MILVKRERETGRQRQSEKCISHKFMQKWCDLVNARIKIEIEHGSVLFNQNWHGLGLNFPTTHINLYVYIIYCRYWAGDALFVLVKYAWGFETFKFDSMLMKQFSLFETNEMNYIRFESLSKARATLSAQLSSAQFNSARSLGLIRFTVDQSWNFHRIKF